LRCKVGPPKLHQVPQLARQHMEARGPLLGHQKPERAVRRVWQPLLRPEAPPEAQPEARPGEQLQAQPRAGPAAKLDGEPQARPEPLPESQPQARPAEEPAAQEVALAPREEAEQDAEQEAEQAAEQEGEQDAEQEEQSPGKTGRRRRRRRHRRGNGTALPGTQNSSGDDSGPSQESVAAATPKDRNVVTWSDLGGEVGVKRALPVGRVAPAAGSQHEAPFPPALAPAVVMAPVVPAWQVPWACAGAVAVPCAAQVATGAGVAWASVAEPQSEWTDKHSNDLRRWLCSGLGGGGVPRLSELAELLQDLAQEAYED